MTTIIFCLGMVFGVALEFAAIVIYIRIKVMRMLDPEPRTDDLMGLANSLENHDEQEEWIDSLREEAS